MDKTVLKQLKWVARACAKDNTRPVLRHIAVQRLPGVYGPDGPLCAVAADGFRVHIYPLPHTCDMTEGLYDSKTFSPSDYGGLFPDVNSILAHIWNRPRKHYVFTVRQDRLEIAIKTVGIFSQHSANSTRFKLSSSGVLEIKGKSTEYGDADVCVATDHRNPGTLGVDSDVSLNYTYVLDALKNPALGDRVQLMLSERDGYQPKSAAPTAVVGDTENGFAVIMEMDRTRGGSTAGLYRDPVEMTPSLEHEGNTKLRRSESKTAHQDTTWHISPASKKDGTKKSVMGVPVIKSNEAERPEAPYAVHTLAYTRTYGRETWDEFTLGAHGYRINLETALADVDTVTYSKRQREYLWDGETAEIVRPKDWTWEVMRDICKHWVITEENDSTITYEKPSYQRTRE